eukprot:267988-Rhodomonas_salina.1
MPKTFCGEKEERAEHDGKDNSMEEDGGWQSVEERGGSVRGEGGRRLEAGASGGEVSSLARELCR